MLKQVALERIEAKNFCKVMQVPMPEMALFVLEVSVGSPHY